MGESVQLSFDDVNSYHGAIKINTGSSCFLCLRDILGSSCGAGEGGCFDYNLLPIFRLIGLPPSNVQLADFFQPNNEAKRSGSGEVSVNLCGQCGLQINALLELYKQLEFIKKQVNWKLREVTEVLKESINDKERNNLFRSTMCSSYMEIDISDSQTEYKLVVGLRNEIMAKCQTMLITGEPRVSISPLIKTEKSETEHEIADDEPKLFEPTTFTAPASTPPHVSEDQCTVPEMQNISTAKSCKKCGKEFRNSRILKQHQEKTCPFRDQIDGNSQRKTKKLLRIQPKPEPSLPASSSQVITEQQQPLPTIYITSLENPSNLSPGQKACQRCGKVVVCEGNLNRHFRYHCPFGPQQKRIQPKLPKMSCPVCGVLLHHKSLPRHVKKLHPDYVEEGEKARRKSKITKTSGKDNVLPLATEAVEHVVMVPKIERVQTDGLANINNFVDESQESELILGDVVNDQVEGNLENEQKLFIS